MWEQGGRKQETGSRFKDKGTGKRIQESGSGRKAGLRIEARG